MLFMVFHMLFTNIDYVSFFHISVNIAGTPKEGNVLQYVEKGRFFCLWGFHLVFSCFFFFVLVFSYTYSKRTTEGGGGLQF